MNDLDFDLRLYGRLAQFTNCTDIGVAPLVVEQLTERGERIRVDGLPIVELPFFGKDGKAPGDAMQEYCKNVYKFLSKVAQKNAGALWCSLVRTGRPQPASALARS